MKKIEVKNGVELSLSYFKHSQYLLTGMLSIILIVISIIFKVLPWKRDMEDILSISIVACRLKTNELKKTTRVLNTMNETYVLTS